MTIGNRATLNRASLSRATLNRATLERQALLGRQPLSVVDAVRRVVALQAQEPASPYLALWNRVAGFDPAEVDALIADGTLIKATLMRITVHVVHAADYPAFHAAMVPSLRASRLGDRRFTSTGLSVAEVDALVGELLEFASSPRSNAEIERLLADRLGAHLPGAWWALRRYAPVIHAPTGGPWSFGPQPRFVTVPGLPPEPGQGQHHAPDHDAAVRELVRRYLEGFGPASVADVAQFTLLRRPVVRDALTGLGGEVERWAGRDGTELFDVHGATLPDEDAACPPRLMAMWDSVLLAYADRSRVIPPEYRPHLIRRNGDVLPALLVDGYVAGVWRPVEAGIEATAFHRLTDEAWAGLSGEAAALQAFLGERDPRVYRRYARWWSTLPGAEVRVLPG